MEQYNNFSFLLIANKIELHNIYNKQITRNWETKIVLYFDEINWTCSNLLGGCREGERKTFIVTTII